MCNQQPDGGDEEAAAIVPGKTGHEDQERRQCEKMYCLLGVAFRKKGILRNTNDQRNGVWFIFEGDVAPPIEVFTVSQAGDDAIVSAFIKRGQKLNGSNIFSRKLRT